MKIDEGIARLETLLERGRAVAASSDEFGLPSIGTRAYVDLALSETGKLLRFADLLKTVYPEEILYIERLIDAARGFAHSNERTADSAVLSNYAGVLCARSGRFEQAVNLFVDASIDANRSNDADTLSAATLNRAVLLGGLQASSPTIVAEPQDDRDGPVMQFQRARVALERARPPADAVDPAFEGLLDRLGECAQHIVVVSGLESIASIEALTYLAGVERDYAVWSNNSDRLERALSLAQTASIFAQMLPDSVRIVALSARANFASCQFEHARMIENELLPFARRRLGESLRELSENYGANNRLTIAAGINYAVATLELSRKPLIGGGQLSLMDLAVRLLEELAQRTSSLADVDSEVHASILNNLALAKVDVAIRSRSARSWNDAKVASEAAASSSSIVRGSSHPATRLLVHQARRCEEIAQHSVDNRAGGSLAVITRLDSDFRSSEPEYVHPNAGWTGEHAAARPDGTSAEEETSESEKLVLEGETGKVADERRKVFLVGAQVNARIVRAVMKPSLEVDLDVNGTPGRLRTREAHFLLANNLSRHVRHGEIAKCVVTGILPDGSLFLSINDIEEIGWQLAFESYQERRTIHGTVVGTQENGLTVFLGRSAFLATKRAEFEEDIDLELYLGRMVKAVVVKVNKDTGVILLEWRDAPADVLQAARLLEDAGGFSEEGIAAEHADVRGESRRSVGRKLVRETPERISVSSTPSQEVVTAVVAAVTESGLHVTLGDGSQAVILERSLPKLPIGRAILAHKPGDIVFCVTVRPTRLIDAKSVASALLPREILLSKFNELYPPGSAVPGRILYPGRVVHDLYVRLAGGFYGYMRADEGAELAALLHSNVERAFFSITSNRASNEPGDFNLRLASDVS